MVFEVTKDEAGLRKFISALRHAENEYIANEIESMYEEASK